MINKNLKKKIISGVMLGSVITSLGIGAFASDLDQTQTSETINSNSDSKVGTRENRENRKYKARTEETGEECDLSGEQRGNRRGNKKGHAKIEENLAESGIFTDSEVEEIKTYLESKRLEMDEKMNEKRELLKDKTPEERRAYHEENRSNHQNMMKEKQNVMDELVANGTITQAQLDQLKEIMPQRNQIKATK